MSLPALISGADCGPGNPLQGLSKQFDRDRSIQQDHFASSSRAGPSRQTFRTQHTESSQSAALAHDANQFFSRQTTIPSAMSTPFDLSSLSHALPNEISSSGSVPHFRPQGARTPVPAWALDFTTSPTSSTPIHQSAWKAEFGTAFEQTGPSSAGLNQADQVAHALPPLARMGMQPQYMGHSSMHRQMIATSSPLLQQQTHTTETDWATHFASIEEETLPAPIHAPAESQAQATIDDSQQAAVEADDLAGVAGLLIDSMKNETNPRFKQSQFMGLMHRIRGREVIVEGNDMVEKDTRTSYLGENGSSGWADEFSGSTTTPLSSASVSGAEARAVASNDKGKGRGIQEGSPVLVGSAPPLHAYAPTTLTQPQHYSSPMNEYDTKNPLGEYYRMAMQLDQRRHQHVDSLSQESISLSKEEPESPVMLGRDYLLRDQSTNGSHIMEEWGRLQASWDELDTTASGLVYNGEQQLSGSEDQTKYVFQTTNPYLQTTRNHMMHTGQELPHQSVLQTEAAVQQEPHNAERWFELGVKQQENEREEQAIQALHQAVHIDPKHLPSLLALAVSHTNENDREASLDAIQHWIDANDAYAEVVSGWRKLNDLSIEKNAGSGRGSLKERQKELLECLMMMARMSPDGQIDPDVQIALGVLLNTSEEYSKAQDCFQAALTVRPNDWLLYNRVGATLANSGRPAEAVGYYFRALELNPSYIRARFNLGISCINLRMFDEAARHILDALVLQEQDDSPEKGVEHGLPNSTLWESLQTACIHLQRNDLIELCERKDLNGFREAFTASKSGQELQDFETPFPG